ncbi:MAG: hypothetical protein B7Y83_00270 [Flavobacteriales bacterium 32-34-25]|nr:MAG: hypothetical protein B7Y83_00270 [Flavobacteriales bacterium 32-34-25]
MQLPSYLSRKINLKKAITMDIFFKSRSLKISSQFVKNLWRKPTVKPKLTLSGKWMQDAGFEIGEEVNISVSKNLLIISKA